MAALYDIFPARPTRLVIVERQAANVALIIMDRIVAGAEDAAYARLFRAGLTSRQPVDLHGWRLRVLAIDAESRAGRVRVEVAAA